MCSLQWIPIQEWLKNQSGVQITYIARFKVTISRAKCPVDPKHIPSTLSSISKLSLGDQERHPIKPLMMMLDDIISLRL